MRQELTVPTPGKLMGANDRAHPMQRANATRGWRNLARILAQDTLTPYGPQRVHVVATVHRPTRRLYDVGNVYPTVKALLDGVVEAGVLDGDDNARVLGPDLRYGAPDKAAPRIVLTFAPCEALAEDVAA